MKKIKSSIFAVALGNCIEVYDYSHFIYFSSIIAVYFFPKTSQQDAFVFILLIYAIEHLLSLLLELW